MTREELKQAAEEVAVGDLHGNDKFHEFFAAVAAFLNTPEQPLSITQEALDELRAVMDRAGDERMPQAWSTLWAGVSVFLNTVTASPSHPEEIEHDGKTWVKQSSGAIGSCRYLVCPIGKSTFTVDADGENDMYYSEEV